MVIMADPVRIPIAIRDRAHAITDITDRACQELNVAAGRFRSANRAAWG